MNLIPATKSEWKEYFATCSASSIYQDPRWLELIETIYPGLTTHRLACLDDTKDLAWLLPLVGIKPLGSFKPMLISVPFGNYGGFIFPGQVDRPIYLKDLDPDPLKSFFSDHRADALEIREIQKPLHEFPFDDQFKRFELSLTEPLDVLWNSVITGNARTGVRKADKNAVKIHFDHPRSLEIFKRIYEKNAAFHGTPIHKSGWFDTIKTLFHEETHILLAEHENQFVGAALIFLYRGNAILNSLATDPKSRNIPVSDKLVWESIRLMKEKYSAEAYDFGRTRPDPGQLFFKRKWGGVESPIYYSYLLKTGRKAPRILPDNPKFKMGIKLWKILPMFMTRRIGPILRPRIPT